MIYFHEIRNIWETTENLLVLAVVLAVWVWMTIGYYDIWLKKTKEKKWKILWACLYFASLFLHNSRILSFPVGNWIPVILLFGEVVLGSACALCYQESWERKLAASCAWMVGMLFVHVGLFSHLWGFSDSSAEQFLLLEQLTLFGFLAWNGWCQREEERNSRSFYLFGMSALPLGYGVLYFVFRETDLYRIANASIKNAAIAAILVLDAATIFFCKKMEDYARKEEETRMLRDLVKACSNQIALMQESQQKMKALRHDLKHHLVELANMAKNREDEKLQVYIGEMEQFLLNPAEHSATGNASVDTILNYMLEKAEQNGCQIETKLQIPENWYEGSFSFCVILGNLLDNAVREAVKSEEKYLFVGICEKQGVLIIQVKNSCGEETEEKREGDHGYGIENVERVVASLGGEFTHEQGEGWYEANVMLYSRSVREGMTA